MRRLAIDSVANVLFVVNFAFSFRIYMVAAEPAATR
jgi:hypothetical protein